MTPWKLARFRSRFGPWAVIAGGSDGIGAEFARRLANLGLNLMLAARRENRLAQLARQLMREHSVEVRYLPCDLSDRTQLEKLIEETSSLDVGLLVCSAAASEISRFLDQPADSHERLLALNCRAPLLLAHGFGLRMKAAGHGGIVLLSSLAALQGTVLAAHYAASKAYLWKLAEGLWAELRPYGIAVTACCPATVDTPTFRSDYPVTGRPGQLPVMEVGPVVRQCLGRLGKAPIVIPGVVNKLAAILMGRILPRRMLIRTTERSMRTMYPHIGT